MRFHQENVSASESVTKAMFFESLVASSVARGGASKGGVSKSRGWVRAVPPALRI